MVAINSVMERLTIIERYEKNEFRVMAKLRKIVGMFLRKSLPILVKRGFVRGYSFLKISHLQSGLLT